MFGYAQEHVLSRSVRDTAALLDYTCKPMPGDPFEIEAPRRPYLLEIGSPPGPLRLAYTKRTWAGEPIDAEIALAVDEVASVCETLGLQVESAAPDVDWEQYAAVAARLLTAEVGPIVDALIIHTGRRASRDTLEAVTLDAYEQAKHLRASELLDALSARNVLRRQVGQFFLKYDVLLTPTMASTPPPLGTLNQDQAISIDELWRRTDQLHPHLELFNVTGQPAISLPLAETRTGMPIGIQLVTRFGDEANLLRLSAALEEVRPWRHRRPTTHVASLGPNCLKSQIVQAAARS